MQGSQERKRGWSGVGSDASRVAVETPPVEWLPHVWESRGGGACRARRGEATGGSTGPFLDPRPRLASPRSSTSLLHLPRDLIPCLALGIVILIIKAWLLEERQPLRPRPPPRRATYPASYPTQTRPSNPSSTPTITDCPRPWTRSNRLYILSPSSHCYVTRQHRVEASNADTSKRPQTRPSRSSCRAVLVDHTVSIEGHCHGARTPREARASSSLYHQLHPSCCKTTHLSEHHAKESLGHIGPDPMASRPY